MLWTLVTLWVACLVYWLTLAHCGDDEAACSNAHLTMNEILFGGILVLPPIIAVLAVAVGIRRIVKRGK